MNSFLSGSMIPMVDSLCAAAADVHVAACALRMEFHTHQILFLLLDLCRAQPSGREVYTHSVALYIRASAR